jgi:hypothetical protein
MLNAEYNGPYETARIMRLYYITALNDKKKTVDGFNP